MFHLKDKAWTSPFCIRFFLRMRFDVVISISRASGEVQRNLSMAAANGVRCPPVVYSMELKTAHQKFET